MFDPTAFDNMKVIMEGALYDRDLSGDIVITDRNDIINMAKMSRQFNISFMLPKAEGQTVRAKMELESKLVNLAAELLTGTLSEELAGCYVKLYFYLEEGVPEQNYHEIHKILQNVWGTTRRLTITAQYDPLKENRKLSTIITVDFERLISEDQMDDLVEMADFMVDTLEQLSKQLARRDK